MTNKTCQVADNRPNKATPEELDRIRDALARSSVEVDGMPDNLAIALCSYFSDHLDRPDPDPDTERGWGEWVEKKTDEALMLIAQNAADLIESLVQKKQEPDAH